MTSERDRLAVRWVSLVVPTRSTRLYLLHERFSIVILLVQWRYYSALLVSGLSMVGWVGALVSGLVAFYFAVAGGPVLQFSTYMIVAISAGVVFALVEKRLYREDW